MVILDADRFGIAQLHQLRRRVGRGVHESRCFLLGEPTTSDGEACLKALVDSTDTPAWPTNSTCCSATTTPTSS